MSAADSFATAPDRRRALLVAALGFARLEPHGAAELPALTALRTWLGSLRGVGLIAETMLRQGYDLALTSDERGWRASFLHRNHLTRPWVGQVLNWWPTPWRAVQEGAWRALNARQARDLSLTEEPPP